MRTKSGELPLFGRHLECLLVLSVEEPMLALVFLLPGDLGFLASIIQVQVGGVAGALKVVPDLFSCLIIVESQREAGRASANTLQVVFLDLSLNNVSHVGHLLEILLIAVLGKPAQVDVHDVAGDWVVFDLVINTMSVVTTEV